MEKKRIKYVCTTCGSEDVHLDANAEWDIEKQEWILCATFDTSYCNNCDGECLLKEVAMSVTTGAKVP